MSNRGGDHSLKMYRAALHAWLSFLGRSVKRGTPPPTGRWQRWIDEYDQFLASDRGLADATRLYRLRYARCFLQWMFRIGAPKWDRINVKHVWQFSEGFARKLKPASANVMLFSLKNFLRFLHLRGLCTSNLACAVPHFSNYGQAVRTAVLSEKERCQLLAAFPMNDARALRDRAIVHCLLELGLRAREAVDLKTTDIDWAHSCLRVPAVKSGRPRQLPLPAHVADALRAYVLRGRGTGGGEHLFLRHRSLSGRPFTLSGLRQAMHRAYLRCGFPAGWTGTHRLRHSFATRLYRHGADPKQIADLLGHRALASTDTYVQSDLVGLRTLARPWPS